MDEIDPVRDRIDHGQVSSEGPQRAVGALRVVLGMGGGSLAWLSHALHIDVDEVAEMGDELRDVDAGASVDGRRVLAGHDGHVHGLIVPQRRRRQVNRVALLSTNQKLSTTVPVLGRNHRPSGTRWR